MQLNHEIKRLIDDKYPIHVNDNIKINNNDNNLTDNKNIQN